MRDQVLGARRRASEYASGVFGAHAILDDLASTFSVGAHRDRI